MPESAKQVRLAPSTLAAFTSYIAEAEIAMQPCFRGESLFLSADHKPDLLQRVRDGKISAQLWSGNAPVHVPDGLIHDWIGIAFVPAATAAETLALIQDYDNHKHIYQPEVIESRLLHHDGNDFQILLRLRKKKVVTVVLDTWHDVRYTEVSPGHWTCCSSTTRICEVDNAGTPKEVVAESDNGYGYLWRLNSYWNIHERDAGVWLECRAISLTRDIPKGLAWIIEPIIGKLPRESLIHTLQATRQAITQRKVPPVSPTKSA